jgi:flagellar biogenesis protein FliO
VIAMRAIIAAMLMMLPARALAQTTQATAVDNPIRRTTAGAAPATTAPAATVDTFRVVTALAAVIALIVVLRWCVRRLAPGVMGRTSRAVHVLARCPVSHKQQILVVQVGRRLLVVGESAAGLNTLSEITDPDECAALLGQLSGADVSVVLQSAAMTQEKSADEPAEAPGEELSFARQQLSALTEKVRVVARQLNRA